MLTGGSLVRLDSGLLHVTGVLSMASLLKSDNLGKLLIRITVGGLMLFHGVSKLLHGVGGVENILVARGWPGPIAYGVYLAEIIAPILIIVGFRTRLAALIVALEMILAIVLAHSKSVFALKAAGGGWAIELEVFFLLASVALFFMGAGSYAASKGRSVWD
jgi:putative oxidoreductase